MQQPREIIFVLLATFLVVNSYPSASSRICKSSCPPGTHIKTFCTETSETKCQPCEDGTFSDRPSQSQTCTRCSFCPAGSYIEKLCTRYHDTTCTSCSNVPDIKSEEFHTSCTDLILKRDGIDLHDVMMADGQGETAAPPRDNADQGAHPENVDQEPKSGQDENVGTNNDPGEENLENKDPAAPTEKDIMDPAAAEDQSESTKNENLKTPQSAPEDTHGETFPSDGGDLALGGLDTSEAASPTVDTPETIASVIPEQESKAPTEEELIPIKDAMLEQPRLDAVKLDEHDVDDGKTQNGENQTTSGQPSEVTQNDDNDRVHDDKIDVTAGTENVDIDEETTTEADPLLYPVLAGPDVIDPVTQQDQAKNDLAAGAKTGEVNSEKPKEESKGKQRAAIILGVAIGGVVFFVLAFFASRYCKNKKRMKFKEMKKVAKDRDEEAADVQLLNFSNHPETTSIDEPIVASSAPALYQRGPGTGPSTPQTNHTDHGMFSSDSAPESSQNQDESIPEKRLTTPDVKVTPAPPELPESPITEEPFINGIDKMKYIDESTDDEYFVAFTKPFAHLSNRVLHNIVEETPPSSPSLKLSSRSDL